jgi:UDP-N-acetylmuramate dehydrogenase
MSALANQYQGELKLNEPMAKHTSWRVGGVAERFYTPTDVNDLAVFLQTLPADEPVMWLGLGSNLLVRDGGIAGTVICSAGSLQTIAIKEQSVTAEVGVYCGKFAKVAAKAGLQGAAFLAGIPGTMGGALAMNAGAHKSETWDFVTEVTTVNRFGELTTRKPEEFEVEYRYVALPEEEWFAAATLQFEYGDADAEQDYIKSLLKKRNDSQPANQACAGSVFRNPEGDYAGRLIEAAGLKGLSIGGAQVSEKHANFIVNTGDATAQQIEDLIYLVQQKVQDQHGVLLTPEVHVIGASA